MSSDDLTTPQKIMNATWKLMEAGPDGGRAPKVRMSDIAKAAGVSRQAIYLHFETRADLLTSTTHYMDEVLNTQDRLTPFRAAVGGEAKIRAFVMVWAGQLKRIQGVARALLAMRITDTEADTAWRDRMGAMREGCEAAISELNAEGKLRPSWTQTTATDLFATTLSFENWEIYTRDCGWSEDEYVVRISAQMVSTLVAD